MMDFMRAGGYAMWPILVLGIVTLGIAGSFSWAPTERKLGLIRPLSVSMVFMSLASTFAGFAMSAKNVQRVAEYPNNPKLPYLVMMGFGESITALILAFGILSVVWVLMAFGLRRQVRAEKPTKRSPGDSISMRDSCHAGGADESTTMQRHTRNRKGTKHRNSTVCLDVGPNVTAFAVGNQTSFTSTRKKLNKQTPNHQSRD